MSGEYYFAAAALDALSKMGGSKFNSEAANISHEYQKKALEWLPKYAALGAKKAGIHPLHLLTGAASGSMTTVPLQQQNMGGLENLSRMLQVKAQQGNIDEQIKRETLAALKRESQSAKWDYSLLIPVTHPHAPGKTFWGFNPKYQMYGTTAQALVLAANKDEAWKLLMDGVTPEERKRIEQKRKEIQLKAKKGRSDSTGKSIDYGTDIAP